MRRVNLFAKWLTLFFCFTSTAFVAKYATQNDLLPLLLAVIALAAFTWQYVLIDNPNNPN